MKRRLLLAISVLALTAVSEQLFAAEAETPAPSERAAPAARERAPARERAAQRAPQRAPAQRQASSQSPSSSFTGTQAGGFGGGNAGGGGFSDPCFGASAGFAPPSTLVSCTSQTIGRSPVAVAVGGEFGQMFAMGPYAVFGWAADVTGSTMKASSTQTTSHFVPLNGETVTETLSTSQRQPLSSTLRAKIGFVPAAFMGSNVLVFGTAGGAVGKVSGSFTYTASNLPPPGIPTTAFGTANWDVTRFGYVVGGGVTVRYSVAAITIEYLYNNLGTVTETIPLVASHCAGGPFTCTGFAQTSMKTDSSTVRVKYSWGL